MTPDLTVVIPTIGREAGCHEAIRSVERFRKATGLEVDLLVVEQGDRPTYAIPDTFDGRWLFSTRPAVSPARNAGLDAARAPVVLFLDDDAVLEPDATALLDEWRSSGAPMVCGRMRAVDGSYSRSGDRRAIVRGWSASRYFVEPAAIWDTAALRRVGGLDERMGAPTAMGAEEGAQLLGRLASAGEGCGVFVPVDVVVHPKLTDAPPEKARRYGRGTTGALVLAPGWWLVSYVVVSGLRRLAGLVVAVARRDRAARQHRAAWLLGYCAGFRVGFAVRHEPQRGPSDVRTIVPAEP